VYDRAFDPARHRANDVRAEADQIVRGILPPPAAELVEPGAVADSADTAFVEIEGGYRVQLAMPMTPEHAEAVAERARANFPRDSVYVIFQAPSRKIRVGDFRTYQEVKEKEAEARSKGYADAFWVPSRVRVRLQPGDRPVADSDPER